MSTPMTSQPVFQNETEDYPKSEVIFYFGRVWWDVKPYSINQSLLWMQSLAES